MKTLWILAAAGAVALGVPAWAQTSPGMRPGPTVQHSPGDIDYISGGVGEEERTRMAAQQQAFPFKVVLSAEAGEYVVADKLSVLARQGELLTIRDAGPLVMMKLPAGSYTVEATWHGKTASQHVTVGGAAQTLNWRLGG